MRTVILLLSLILAGPVFSHSGGTNDNGCHNDHKNGGYHCHSGLSWLGELWDYMMEDDERPVKRSRSARTAFHRKNQAKSNNDTW